MQHNEKIHTFSKNMHRNTDCSPGLARVPHVERGNPSRKGQAMFGYKPVKAYRNVGPKGKVNS